jgi:hypothetical protein
MNTARIVVVSCTICLSLLFGLGQSPTVETVHTKSFCAYNRVFVEFEEGNKRWGALLLDRDGRPIPCDEDNLPKEKTKNRGII